jgi:membrane protein YdbS with pleckstrin-like domain
MRPEQEWFKPEKLTRYFFAAEVLALVPIVVVVGVLTYSGIVFEMNRWVVYAGTGAVVAAFGFLTWWIPAFSRSAAYRLGTDEVEYERGVFFQQKTTVPYNRITNVNAAQGPLQRLVNAGAVGIHTAGYGGQMGAELTISGVSDYEDVKEQILARVRGRPARATEGDDSADATATPEEDRGEFGEMLVELRRIRKLLEQDRPA